MAYIHVTDELVSALQSLNTGYRDLCNEFSLRMHKLSKYQHGVVDIEDCTDPDLERVNIWSGVVQFVAVSVDNHLLYLILRCLQTLFLRLF